MKSVGEFWFRIGIGVVLLLAGVLVSAASGNGAGVFLMALGVIQLAWTVIAANLLIRKAKKLEEQR